MRGALRGAELCSAKPDASIPSVINMDEVMRARITSTGRTQTAIWGKRSFPAGRVDVLEESPECPCIRRVHALLPFEHKKTVAGLALRGIRGNEARSATIGLHAYRYKLAAFVLSGALCSVAGALLANLAQFVSPSYMHWGRSAEMLLMVLLGGMGGVLGPLAGAAVFMGLEELGSLVTSHWPALMGLFLVFVVLYARNGLTGLAGRLWPSPKGAR
jgi:ABC-type uncharacterized transport system permease subunit